MTSKTSPESRQARQQQKHANKLRKKTAISKERWSDSPPPEVPWHMHQIPDHGTYGDQFWAAILRYSVHELHRLVSREQIPHEKTGSVIYIHAEDFHAYLRTTARHTRPARQPAKKTTKPTTPKRK